MEAFVLVRSLHSDEINLVWNGSDYVKPLKAADVRAILGDRVPVIAYDDSGPDGRLRFPLSVEGARLGVMLRDQLNDALRSDDGCPAESFPEPADFAEPPGGEYVRVTAEEAAHLDILRAEAERTGDLLYGGWRPGERFVIGQDGDAARFAAAVHIWTRALNRAGRVIDRVLLHTGPCGGDHALLVQVDGWTERVVVRVGVLSACAKKVTS